MEALLHVYHPKRPLLLLEYTPTRDQASSRAPRSTSPPNVLLFVGGLYDNFRSPRYPDDLASLFPRDVPDQQWRVMHVQLSSAGRSWGMFDLDRDVDELSAAVTFIRETVTQNPSTPVVLMGHSTGCQDLMHYLVSPSRRAASRPSISGAIFQAPVSDREAILRDADRDPSTKTAYDSALALASMTPQAKHKTTFLPLDIATPLLGPSPITISRFLSLASPGSPANPAMDDYFSSDLTEARLRDTFGRIGAAPHFQPPTGRKSVLILQGGADESIPDAVDKGRLLARWRHAVASDPATSASLSAHSTVIANAVHDISGETAEARTARLVDMRGAVLRYLEDAIGGAGLDRATPNGPWAIFDADKKMIENGSPPSVAGLKL